LLAGAAPGGEPGAFVFGRCGAMASPCHCSAHLGLEVNPALEEGQKLARALHDSVSHALYGIALGARAARTLLDRDPQSGAVGDPSTGSGQALCRTEQRMLRATDKRMHVARANHPFIRCPLPRNHSAHLGLEVKPALEEGQKLARELHDSVSQALYGIALGARAARTLLGRDSSLRSE